MVIGNPESYAVEALVEPGPEFPPVAGNNVAGRMRLLVRGAIVGDIKEPSCIPRVLSEHLLEVCGRVGSLWHPLLADRSPEQQFEILDKALFLGGGAPQLEKCHAMVFLTNVSEAFDSVKGFVLSRSGVEFEVLLRLEDGGPVLHRIVPRAEFSGVAVAFDDWVNEQERRLLYGSAV